MSPLCLPAPAKLNLHLHVTGRRGDGYHLIESLVVFTRFGDSLEFHPADELSLEITGDFASALVEDKENNLVMRAARGLQRYAPGKGAKIRLHKHIPLGAGLGGGSSDAAVALRGLMQLWDIDAQAFDIHALASSLGSDVPVCLYGRPAWITGIGDIVAPCGVSAPLWALLVNPRRPLSTPEIYRRFSGAFAEASGAPALHAPRDVQLFARHSSNMLEPAATEFMPVIQEILASIQHTTDCLMARMSGSGATCFGLYADAEAAAAARDAIRDYYPDFWCNITDIDHGQTQ